MVLVVSLTLQRFSHSPSCRIELGMVPTWSPTPESRPDEDEEWKWITISWRELSNRQIAH
jgi:hypothetical protein